MINKIHSLNNLYKVLLLFFLVAIISIPTYIVLANNTNTNTVYCSQAATPYLFGTLETDPARAAQECTAGIQVATQTIGWQNYEQSEGVFDEAYMDDVMGRIKTDLAAGMKIVISPAIHYPPSWVMNQLNSRYINQYGVAAPITWAGGYEEPNFIFSQTMRDQVARFETHVMQRLASNPAIGLKNIWAVRYVNGSIGETMYPPADDQRGHTNSYWAYDANAQGRDSDRPATIPANPFPNWRPGATAYQGRPFSIIQVQQWYTWYLNAHTDFVNWHTKLYRNVQGINYQGYLMLLTPGFGARASEYNASIAHYLDGSQDTNMTVARAAVWYQLFPALTKRTNVIAYVSSMADGSGRPKDNLCNGNEAWINYALDPQVNNWSATRYIAGLANKYGMLKSGENPGSGDPNIKATNHDGLQIMQTAAMQMQSCHLQSMFWAHDINLYDRSIGVTLKNYAQIIAQYNGVAKPTRTITSQL